MKIRIWIDGMPLEMLTDKWLILGDGSLRGIKKNVIDSVFYCWQKIEALPDSK